MLGVGTLFIQERGMKHPGIALALASAVAVTAVPGFRPALPDQSLGAPTIAVQVSQAVSWEGRLGVARHYIVAAAADARVGNLSAFNDVLSRILQSKPTATAVNEDMRQLWSDHATRTRDYIVAATADAPGQKAAAGRMMQNQEDIGSAVAGFYGKHAGDALTVLLNEHNIIAVEVIRAAKAGDKPGMQQADARWQTHGVNIAHFLSKLSPH
jgi:hypothetical protein